MAKRLVIIQAAGLGYDFLLQNSGKEGLDIVFQPLGSVFPAVTCTAQASFRTALPPSGHGMIANGLFHRELRRPLFWEQSSALVSGPRIWDSFRQRGKRVAMLFWQQSLGEACDFILSPAPIHKHGGGMVMSVYSQPARLYASLRGHLHRDFALHRYWGPLASAKSSRWIAEATAALLADPQDAPDLCLTYLPALDYDLQRQGPDHSSARRALRDLLDQIALIRQAAADQHYDVLVFGDYAIEGVSKAVFPNQHLHAAGLFRTRTVAHRLYPDFHTSSAFAMVDHQIAHVYLQPGQPHRGDSARRVRALLSSVEGIDQVLDRDMQSSAGIAHGHSGELVLVAKPGYWFAYPWWDTKREAPDFAGHVDIHNKPGYDPCELFLGWPPGTVSQNTTRIRGSHGRPGTTAWGATFALPGQPGTLPELAAYVRQHLESLP